MSQRNFQRYTQSNQISSRFLCRYMHKKLAQHTGCPESLGFYYVCIPYENGLLSHYILLTFGFRGSTWNRDWVIKNCTDSKSYFYTKSTVLVQSGLYLSNITYPCAVSIVLWIKSKFENGCMKCAHLPDCGTFQSFVVKIFQQ